jgi:hypothetical protein
MMFKGTVIAYLIFVGSPSCFRSCAALCDRIAVRSWRACVMNMKDLQTAGLKSWRLGPILWRPLSNTGRMNGSPSLVCLTRIIWLPRNTGSK